MKTGGTFPEYAAGNNDFEHWAAANMGLAHEEWQCVNVQAGETMPDPAEYAGTVITGSHDMVTDMTPWMRTAARWTRQAVAAGHPMLGICFGHQLMADALGGKAGYHPDGIEVGTVAVSRLPESKDDPIFSTLPDAFPGHVTHSQTALVLPPDSVHLATGTHDTHQAFRVGRHAWGVQFHPEFDAAAIRRYIRELTGKLTEAGRDVPAIEAAVTETPEAASLLKAFADYSRAL